MVQLDETLKMLKDLTDARAIAGNEKESREVMKIHWTICNEIESDNLGAVIAEKVGDPNGPKIMVAGHLDEVGFMVTQIDDKGFIKFQTVGGWWAQVMLSQRVRLPLVLGKKLSESLVRNLHIFYQLDNEKNIWI